MENGSTYTVEVYTDGSKIGDIVGAAGIIFVKGKLVHQQKFKLHGHCSNNQAEQIAILKILEKLEELQEGKDNDKHAAVYTDSKITLDLLQNKFKRNRLIELIRNKLVLVHQKWIVHVGWVEGHAGLEGNELVDRLAKEAAVEDGAVVTHKIPIFPKLTTMLTGHGKIRLYLYRLGITDNPMCSCEEQTVDHLIFKCKKLCNQRNEMI